MAGSHVRLIEKIGVATVDVPRFIWAMRPAWMSSKPDYPWVYYSNINRPVKWEKAERGVLCDWSGVTDLWVSTVFPRLGYRMLKRAFLHWPLAFSDTAAKNAGPIDVSFVIGHQGRERLPLLLAALQSIAGQTDARIECVVVEQSVRPEIQSALPDWVRYIHTPLPHSNMPYCRPWALNVGARAARGSILVLHDGDVCVPMHYAREVAGIARVGYQVIRLLRFRFDLDIKTSSAVLASHRLPAHGKTEMIFQNFSGGTSVAVDRDTYFSLGGYDEEFVGWGPEDEEFFQRCRQVKTYPYMYVPFLHFHHPMQPTRGSQSQTRTRELFEARAAIPPDQRIAELRDRPFGNVRQPAPPYAPESAAGEQKKHLVLVTYGLPYSPDKDGKWNDFEILKKTAQEYKVLLLSVLRFPREAEYVSNLKPYCTLVHTVGAKPHSLWERLYGALDGLFSRRPAATAPYFYYELFLALRDIVRNWPIDVVQIGGCFLAPYIEAVPADNPCRKVLLLHDMGIAPHDRSLHAHPGFMAPWTRLKQTIGRRWEIRFAGKFDRVLVRSSKERQWLLARNPDLPIAVIEDLADTRAWG